MIELKKYSTDELCAALNIKKSTFKSHKKKILKNYEYEETKVGRSKIYTLINYKEEKSIFIKLCEELANEDVSFPNEKTAERILEKLFQVDCSILDDESLGYEVGLERHTVGSYINLFRQYKILPPELPITKRKILNPETGEIEEQEINLNNYADNYAYYVVSRKDDYREALTKKEWRNMHKFIRDRKNEYLLDFVQVLELDGYSEEEKEEAAKEYEAEANRFAYIDCIKENGGVPRRNLLKAPTNKAFEVLGEYFNLKTKTYI